MGRVQNFNFGSILSTFFFEHVLGISPRVEDPPHWVWDMAQSHWADAMRRLGGGRVSNPYPADFFPWWQRQIVAIDDYPYAGIDFLGDIDMPLPPWAAYSDIGNESQTLSLNFFELLIFLCFLIYRLKRHVLVWRHIVTTYHMYADIGPRRPDSFLIIDRGEEEMISWVWMWSRCSKASTQNLYDWHTGYPWRKSRTFLRIWSVRWLGYHEHGFGYSDN